MMTSMVRAVDAFDAVELDVAGGFVDHMSGAAARRLGR